MKNIKLIIKLVVLLGLVTLSACSKTQTTKNDAGFLPDYSKLSEDPDRKGIRSWVDASVSAQGFNSILLTPVVIKLSPELIKKGGKPKPELLEAVVQYLDKALLREFSKHFKVADKPGKGVLRYQSAITGVGVLGGFDEWYDYLPAKAVVNVASSDTSTYAFLFMETYFSDSASGKVYAEFTRADSGEKQSDLDEVTLDDLRPVIDKWASATAKAVADKLGD